MQHGNKTILRLKIGHLVFLALLALSCANETWAQARKGTLAGHVTDATGGVLKGAQVALEPQSVSTASDVQGEFFINNLDPGTYTLTITYVGFGTFTKSVEITAGQTVTADATLAVESQSLGILVHAERGRSGNLRWPVDRR